MKPQRKKINNAPFIKLGGASFNLDEMSKFESKEAFVEHYKDLHCAKDVPAYLSDVWDLAHRENDFKQAVNIPAESESPEQIKPESKPQVKPKATAKKSEQKKE